MNFSVLKLNSMNFLVLTVLCLTTPFGITFSSFSTGIEPPESPKRLPPQKPYSFKEDTLEAFVPMTDEEGNLLKKLNNLKRSLENNQKNANSSRPLFILAVLGPRTVIPLFASRSYRGNAAINNIVASQDFPKLLEKYLVKGHPLTVEEIIKVISVKNIQLCKRLHILVRVPDFVELHMRELVKKITPIDLQFSRAENHTAFSNSCKDLYERLTAQKYKIQKIVTRYKLKDTTPKIKVIDETSSELKDSAQRETPQISKTILNTELSESPETMPSWRMTTFLKIFGKAMAGHYFAQLEPKTWSDDFLSTASLRARLPATFTTAYGIEFTIEEIDMVLNRSTPEAIKMYIEWLADDNFVLKLRSYLDELTELCRISFDLHSRILTSNQEDHSVPTKQ